MDSLPKGVALDGVARREPGALRLGGEFCSCLCLKERRGVGDGEKVAISEITRERARAVGVVLACLPDATVINQKNT
jgi:hypothetical protein